MSKTVWSCPLLSLNPQSRGLFARTLSLFAQYTTLFAKYKKSLRQGEGILDLIRM
ncbi:hypothetical protein [Planococcus antarcticus]|uniref:hypothetical protein n=1 Tax=Planococcus antarcticus TaxID=161360 RepID=UPI0012B5E7AC|nr:hypothetical protein [Planococcus antarcticus]